MRALLIVLGLGLGGYGALELVDDPRHLVNIGVWLAGGVLVHDLIIAPLIVAVGYAGSQLLHGRPRRIGIALMVLLLPLVVIAVPTAGRFGAKPDNPTLLDRPYGWGIVGIIVLTTAAVALVEVVQARRRAPSGEDSDS